jgi:cytochrome P450
MEIDKAHPPVVPFSVGKRACLGETLARNNFFLFLTSLFQRFCITRDPKTKESDNTRGGLFRFPPDFKVIFQDRLEFLDRPHE